MPTGKPVQNLLKLHTFGDKLNPMNMKGLTKSKVVSQIKRIINQYYLFVGYLELANMIQKKTTMEKNKKRTTCLLVLHIHAMRKT